MDSKEAELTLRDVVVREIDRTKIALEETLSKMQFDSTSVSPIYLLGCIQVLLILVRSDFNSRYQKHGAFLAYLHETMDLLRSSVLHAFSFRYVAAITLLRSALETCLRGAFFDSLAKREYRNQEGCIDIKRKIRKDGKITSIQFRQLLIEELEKLNPDWETLVEHESAYILDAIKIIQSDWYLYSSVPSVFDIVSDLEGWGVLDKSKDRFAHGHYKILSFTVHNNPICMEFSMRLNENYSIFGEPIYLESATSEYLEELDIASEIIFTLALNVLRHGIDETEYKHTITELQTHVQQISHSKTDYERILQLLNMTIAK
ncbi:MAG: hypothetical protein RTV72_12260 [Candidatus Thorarchaeota archaeon]